jgi:hypothetical protein
MDRSNSGIAVRVTMVLAMFALATTAEAQRTSTTARKPATKPVNQITTPDGRRTGLCSACTRWALQVSR